MQKQVDIVNQSSLSPEETPLELIHAVMHQYRSRQYQVLRKGAHDVTHMESKVLGYFRRHPNGTQSDLAQHSGRDKAQLARLIKGLRERGLLSGEVNEADRRNVGLSLTADGLAVLQALQQQSGQLASQAVAGFSADEQKQLMALLHRVHENLLNNFQKK
jgi:DNA-binding MarR family transcriptional regulator